MRGFRRGFVAIVSASALVLVLMPATSSSAAKSSGGEFATHGRKKYPTVAAAHSHRAQQQAAAAAEPQLAYGGGVHGIGVTTGPPRVYLVFWGSQWGTASPAGSTNLSGDTAGVAPRVEALFTGLGTNNELWSGVATQYCESVATGATSCPANAAHVAYTMNADSPANTRAG
jgi:serine protease